jgi:mannose-1-phosphate guanylyltransferase/mannose-6-phosphate isomerase
VLVLPVIMSGGSGTRLWPASTDAQPKQFHALGTPDTLLQATAARVRAEGFLAPVVIANHRHGALVREQLAAIGVEPQAVILEPFGRNTAAVAAVAAAWAERHAPGALVLLMPADHLIADPRGFRAAVAEAAGTAASGRIVTFGITPTGPETGYGYIQSGEALDDKVFAVRRFVEKPARAVAEAYLAEGGYAWNGGIFLYDPAVLLGEARRLSAGLAEAATAALDHATSTEGGLLLDGERFAGCPSLPIDVAVMEKTDRAAVLPLSVGWADIGSWSELWRQGVRDADDNLAQGDASLLDTRGSLVWSDGPSVSAIGLDGLIVIATAGHVLVLPMERAQEVKAIVEARKARTGQPGG